VGHDRRGGSNRKGKRAHSLQGKTSVAGATIWSNHDNQDDRNETTAFRGQSKGGMEREVRSTEAVAGHSLPVEAPGFAAGGSEFAS
jgi:hypothetical protein